MEREGQLYIEGEFGCRCAGLKVLVGYPNGWIFPGCQTPSPGVQQDGLTEAKRQIKMMVSPKGK